MILLNAQQLSRVLNFAIGVLITSPLTSSVFAEKILLVPMMLGSHVVANLHLGEALIQHGHDVYLALPRSSKYNTMVRESRVKPLNFVVPDDAKLIEAKIARGLLYNVTFRGASSESLVKSCTSAYDAHCSAMMHDQAFLDQVRRICNLTS